jgi:hypothetical protein
MMICVWSKLDIELSNFEVPEQTGTFGAVVVEWKFKLERIDVLAGEESILWVRRGV